MNFIVFKVGNIEVLLRNPVIIIGYTWVKKRKIIKLLKEGKKLEAVRYYMRYTGENLRDSKSYIDNLYRKKFSEKFLCDGCGYRVKSIKYPMKDEQGGIIEGQFECEDCHFFGTFG